MKNTNQPTKQKKTSLQKGIRLMLEFSKDNKDYKAKAKFMASWIYKYFYA